MDGHPIVIPWDAARVVPRRPDRERALLDFLPPSVDCKRGDRVTITVDGRERIGTVEDVRKFDDGTFSIDVAFDDEKPIVVERPI